MPAFNAPFGFSTRSQTSTVVLPGSSAGLIIEIFAGTALLLCVAGLYGALAYVVAQRTREIGLRIALGAQRSQAIWLVLRQAAVLVVSGVSIGIVLALASGCGGFPSSNHRHQLYS